MTVPSAKLKIALVVIVLAAVLLAGWKAYADYQSRAAAQSAKQACGRAATYRQGHSASPTVLTVDDALCMQTSPGLSK